MLQYRKFTYYRKLTFADWLNALDRILFRLEQTFSAELKLSSTQTNVLHQLINDDVFVRQQMHVLAEHQ